MNKPKHTKESTMERWANNPANMPIIKHWTPIPYKSKGSSYGACGIRIDGNPEFIDAVLSRLKDLMDGENGITRLELSRQVVDGSKLGKEFYKKERGAEVLYLRLHMRGNEAQRFNTLFDAKATQRSIRFAEAR